MGERFKSRLIAFSAPSGAGKSTIAKRLIARHPEMVISVSATTRAIRPREHDGVDYHFLSQQEFSNRVKIGDFLEHEIVHGQMYGTLRSQVERKLAAGKVVVFDIDVNGALSIKAHYPETILIFIKAPSREALIQRLKMRRSETDESIGKRLERLPFEYEQAKKFDYIIINTDLEQAVREIESLILEN